MKSTHKTIVTQQKLRYTRHRKRITACLFFSLCLQAFPSQYKEWTCIRESHVYVKGKRNHINAIKPGNTINAKLDNTEQWLVIHSKGKEYSMDARDFMASDALQTLKQEHANEVATVKKRITDIKLRLSQLDIIIAQEKKEYSEAGSRSMSGWGFTANGDYVNVQVSGGGKNVTQRSNKSTREKWRLKKELKNLDVKLRKLTR